MKTIKFLQICFLALVLSFVGCKQDTLAPETNPSEVSTTETTPEEIIGTDAVGATTTPTISGMGGASMSPFTSDGKWLGNAPDCGRGSFYGYYVINTHDNADSNNYWDIRGNNFGTTRGTAGSNSSGVSFDIISWSNTVIRIRPKSTYLLDVKTNLSITVTTSTNLRVSYAVNVIGMIANGRGYGQCTWEVAYQRKIMGLSIPNPSAYSTSGSITASYIPQKGDVLHWGKSHTGIILSSPTSATANGVTTYTFILRERNSRCDENVLQTTQTFKKNNSAVVLGISSQATSLGKATTYWR